MFTGIIEATGKLHSIEANGSNKSFWISSAISHELKIDQSVSHDGVCLTVEAVDGNMHRVTAIEETLQKSNLDLWKQDAEINIERCMQMNGRIDGHIVQGHVDTTAVCIHKKNLTGSWQYRFSFRKEFGYLIIEKGSVSLNGISLTIFEIGSNEFSVAIIPYTYEHTNIHSIEMGGIVNIEFDIIGKYLARFKTLQQ